MRDHQDKRTEGEDWSGGECPFARARSNCIVSEIK
jgi:hypothetical protein